MNIKGQLKKLFTVLAMSGFVFSATVSSNPTTLPIGATDAAYYVQTLKITLQENGDTDWANNNTIVITLPVGIGVADTDYDEDNHTVDYCDEVSLSVDAGEAAGINPSCVESDPADAGIITIKLGLGVNAGNDDQIVVIFPVTTDASLPLVLYNILCSMAVD